MFYIASYVPFSNVIIDYSINNLLIIKIINIKYQITVKEVTVNHKLYSSISVPK